MANGFGIAKSVGGLKTYNSQEVAKKLHCSVDHVRRNWRAWGGSKPGRKLVFSERVLIKLVEPCSIKEKIPDTGGSSSSLKTVYIKSPLEQRIKDERSSLKVS